MCRSDDSIILMPVNECVNQEAMPRCFICFCFSDAACTHFFHPGNVNLTSWAILCTKTKNSLSINWGCLQVFFLMFSVILLRLFLCVYCICLVMFHVCLKLFDYPFQCGCKVFSWKILIFLFTQVPFIDLCWNKLLYSFEDVWKYEIALLWDSHLFYHNVTLMFVIGVWI